MLYNPAILTIHFKQNQQQDIKYQKYLQISSDTSIFVAFEKKKNS